MWEACFQVVLSSESRASSLLQFDLDPPNFFDNSRADPISVAGTVFLETREEQVSSMGVGRCAHHFGAWSSASCCFAQPCSGSISRAFFRWPMAASALPRCL